MLSDEDGPKEDTNTADGPREIDIFEAFLSVDLESKIYMVINKKNYY